MESTRGNKTCDEEKHPLQQRRRKTVVKKNVTQRRGHQKSGERRSGPPEIPKRLPQTIANSTTQVPEKVRRRRIRIAREGPSANKEATKKRQRQTTTDKAKGQGAKRSRASGGSETTAKTTMTINGETMEERRDRIIISEDRRTEGPEETTTDSHNLGSETSNEEMIKSVGGLIANDTWRRTHI